MESVPAAIALLAVYVPPFPLTKVVSVNDKIALKVFNVSMHRTWSMRYHESMTDNDGWVMEGNRKAGT